MVDGTSLSRRVRAIAAAIEGAVCSLVFLLLFVLLLKTFVYWDQRQNRWQALAILGALVLYLGSVVWTTLRVYLIAVRK